mmetsp:Transcript_64827/g.204679  ORF Transcript_64827/g.204679 Transcript_64827/m.204679 type:complete len:367 (-) Transcript_64827:774-1874(-)
MVGVRREKGGCFLQYTHITPISLPLEPLHEDLVHHGGVGFALGLFHACPHEEALELGLAAPELLELGLIGFKHGVHDGTDGLGVGDLHEPLLLHQRAHPPLRAPLQEPWEDVLGDLARDDPIFDEDHHLREEGWGECDVPDALLLRLEEAANVPHYPVGGRLGGRALREHGVKVLGHLQVVREHDHVRLGEPQLEESRADLRGGLLHRCGDLALVLLRHRHRGQVRLREVAVIREPLFLAEAHGGLRGLVPRASLLEDLLALALVEERALPLDLKFDGLLHGGEAVHVLDLHLGSELLPPAGTDGDVHVAPHRPLLHVPVADTEEADYAADLRRVLRRLLPRPHVRLRDDLHEGHPRPVVVREGVI